MKLNSFQLYEIDGEQYSLEELREFIRIATDKDVLKFVAELEP